MVTQLCRHLSGLSLASSSRPVPSPIVSSCFKGTRLSVSQTSRTESSRGSLVIVAAQNARKRVRTSEKSRQYNKSRKSAIATRTKKVLKALDEFKEVKAEADLAPVQKLLNEAYEEIDKAIVKGIMKKNTGARRKSRLAVARQKVLIASGLYTPAPAS